MTVSHRLARSRVAILVLGLLAPAGLGAQEPAAAEDPLSLAGCYRLTFRAHTGPFPIRQLERQIWLTTTELAELSGQSTPSYVARPAPGERASQYEAVYWTPRPEGRGLVLTWTTGFHGVTAVIAVDSSSRRIVLSGEARTFMDVIGTSPSTASVTAVPIHCER
jgi:hypothetical protein